MSADLSASGRAAAAALLLALAVPADAGQSVHPTPRPDPLAERREALREGDAARRDFERDHREDRIEWDFGLQDWDEWLHNRGEAERARREDARRNRLERQRPRREIPGKTLGERLEDQWREQRRRLDDRGPGRPRPEDGRGLLRR